jgi:membrane-associated protease RseP (regulator of RpoE activity)
MRMPSFGGRFRITLRALTLALTALSVGLAYYANGVHRQQHAVARVRELGGWVVYEHQLDRSSGVYYVPPWRYRFRPFGPEWLQQRLGPDFFNAPACISLAGTACGDDDLAALSGLRALHSLDLAGTNVTDAGLEHIEQLVHLDRISVSQTRVTQAGRERLRARFPELQFLGYTPLEREVFRVSWRFSPVESKRLGLRLIHCCVEEVLPDLPAADAGIKKGDYILFVNGARVNTSPDVIRAIQGTERGDVLQLTLRRDRVWIAVGVALDR